MPWDIKKRGSQHCVVKQGESTPVPGGCHATRAEAIKHQRALYAGEASTEGSVMTQIEYTTSSNSTNVTFEVVEQPELAWEGILAVEGIVTSDGRYLMPGKIQHRELPLTLMAQTETDEGHKGAWVAGKITAISHQPRPDLGENATAIIGHGVFASDENGQRAHALLSEEILRGVSIDFAPTAGHVLNPDTLEVIDEGELDLADMLSGNFVRGYEGKIMGATLCAFAAFEEATMQIVEAGEEVVVASCFPIRRVLTASAAGLAPLSPPREWFFKEEPDAPCPLTVTSEGQVFGHLALWNQCHRSIADRCEMAPRSRSGYAFFHTGAISCDDGKKINVGRLTVGEGGHASTSPSLGLGGAVDALRQDGDGRCLRPRLRRSARDLAVWGSPLRLPRREGTRHGGQPTLG